MAILPKARIEPANPLTNLVSEVEDKDEAGVWGECNEGQYRNRTRQATVVLTKLQGYESNGSSTIAQVAKLERIRVKI